MPSRALSSTKSLWRLPFGHFSESDTANKAQRARILARHNNTCVDCQLKLTRHMEVRHEDDNHDNNDDANLVCVCPFCHLRDHLGPTGFASAGTMIGVPTLTQGQINALTLAIWYIQARVTSNSDIRHAPGAIDPANEETWKQRLLELSMVIWKDLSINSAKYGPVYSSRITEPDVLGGILNELHANSPEQYADRATLLTGVHILPYREAFNVQCDAWFAEFDRTRPLASWRKGLESFLELTGATQDELQSTLETPIPADGVPADTESPLGKPMGPDPDSEESRAAGRRSAKRYE